MSVQEPLQPDAVELARANIRRLMDEVAQLAEAPLSREEFFAQFLQRAVAALAAVGGAVWLESESGQLQLLYQINLQAADLAADPRRQAMHMRLLRRVSERGEETVIPSHAGSGDDESGNPTPFPIVLAPLPGVERSCGVVEVFQRPDSPVASQPGYVRFLAQMCLMAGEWLKSHALRQLSGMQSLWQELDEFSRLVHESLDLQATAYAVANEGRRLIGCDRVSVAVCRGRACRIAAVSGQDQLDTRSNIVTCLKRLTSRVVAAGEPLWYSQTDEGLPPQIEEAVHDFVDEAFCKSLAVIPLRRPVREGDTESEPDAATGEVVGALIVEQIENEADWDALKLRIDLACEHGGRALANAREHEDLFLMPLWRAIGRSRWLLAARTLPKTLAALAAVVLLVSALVLIPVDFKLSAKGALQPVDRRDVFVEVPGVVTRIHVRQGDRVEPGDVLVELDNTDLDVQLADVVGRWHTTREQLHSVQFAMHDAQGEQGDEVNRLSGQAVQLRQQLTSLEEQKKLLLAKRTRLKVTSPIAGEVITWNLDETLLHRPVAAGQVLLAVADVSGPWELEVYMPENRMGHVIEAQRVLGPHLPVEYVVATTPGAQHHGRVRETHAAAELDEQQGSIVRLRVEIERDDLAEPRPGATVTAKVHCGRASVGYSWFHEVVEFVQSRILF